MWGRFLEGFFGMKHSQNPIEPESHCLRGLEKREADLIALVLSSQGIQVTWALEDGRYTLEVDEAYRHKIDGILSQYHAENRTPYRSARNLAFNPLNGNPPFFAIDPKAKSAAVAVTLLLSLIHAATIYHGNHRAVVEQYGASALYILQGELYRTVTALTLHSDIEHLAGNVVGLLLLIPPLCSLMGLGRGLFLVLLSSSLGNFLNALLYRKAHLSIGASTAVMAIVGILTAWQLRRWVTIREGWENSGHEGKKNEDSREAKDEGTAEKSPLKRIDIHPSILFPLGAGVTLVGMFSGGENTDVAAHVLGFLAGVVITTLYLFASSRRRYISPFLLKDESRSFFKMDTALTLLSVLIVLLSWFKIFHI